MHIYLALLLSLMLPACGTQHASFVYTPGAETLTLWHDEQIPLDPNWRYVDTTMFLVQGKMWNSYLSIADPMETMLFARPTEAGQEILLVSRVAKVQALSTFIFLNGTKQEYGSHLYRQAYYALCPDTSDSEYRRYFALLHTAGIPLAQSYRVEVLDRLPLDTTLVRIMRLYPGTEQLPLPSYAKLYPQERHEPMRIRE